MIVPVDVRLIFGLNSSSELELEFMLDACDRVFLSVGSAGFLGFGGIREG